jgi:tmRNA-binding protein
MHVCFETLTEFTHAQCRNDKVLLMHKTEMETLMSEIVLFGGHV